MARTRGKGRRTRASGKARGKKPARRRPVRSAWKVKAKPRRAPRASRIAGRLPPQVSGRAKVLSFPQSRVSQAFRTLFLKYGQVLTKKQGERFEEFLGSRCGSAVEKEDVYAFLRENPDIRKRIWTME